MSNRPAIPAALKRRVLVEAGHRCAIPTCREIIIHVHHIIPWETCQKHDYQNLIALCANCHGRAHNGDIDRKSLRLYKANLRFAHDKFSQFELDIIFQLGKLPPQNALLFPAILRLLIKRLTDARYVVLIKNPNITANFGGLEYAPQFLRLTLEGQEFLKSLSMDSGY